MNKMTPKNFNWIFILKWVMIIGVLALLLANITINYHRTQLYAAIIEIPVYFFVLFIYVSTSVYDFISIFQKRNYFKTIPSILGLFLIIIGLNIIYFTYQKQSKANKYIAYSSSYDFFKVGYAIDFKNDNTFVAHHTYTTFTYHHYGTYIKKGNFLFLSGEINTKGLCKVMKIIPEPVKSKSKNKIGRLIQVNKSIEKIEYLFKFSD